MRGEFDDEREIEELWLSVRNDLLKRGADVHTAEDVAQETWLRAVRRPPEERGRISGWLHVVARRVLREMRSTQGHRSRRELVVARADHAAPAETGESHLLRCLSELPESYRAVLHLRFIEDREVAEIAETLGLQPETVRSRLKRGLSRLRARVGSPPEKDGRRWAILAWIRECLGGLVEGTTSSRKRLAGSGAAALVCMSAWFLWSGGRTPEELQSVPAPADEPVLVERALLPSPSARTPVVSPPVEAPVPPAPEANGVSLSGLVLTPAGAPVPGALVHVARAEDLATQVVAVADEHGRYRIVAGRRALVWASDSEWCDSLLCYLPSVVEPDRLDLVLSATRSRASVIVRDASGAPVPRARVQLDPLEKPDQIRSPRGTMEIAGPPPSGTTAADGSVELPFPARDWVDLLVEAEGFPAFLSRRPAPRQGGTLTIELPAPAGVSGTCVLEGGLPSWKAHVEVLQLGGLVRREAWTGSDGSFRIEGLTPGEFVLRCGEDLGPLSARYEGVLEPGQSVALPLALGEAATIQGLVLDQGRPVPDMHVQLWPRENHSAEGSGMRDTRTDEHGRFAFAGCKDAPQEIRALPGGAVVGTKRATQPGRGELVLELETDAANLAPLELSFLGDPIDLPRLVELRIEPGFSLLLEPTSEPGRFRSPPLRKGNYGVIALSAALGAWTFPLVSHDPAAPRVHELAVEPPGFVELALVLPAGVHREEVEAELLVECFDVFGLGALGRWRARRVLEWDPAAEVYSGELYPGEYALSVRAPGMAEIFEVVRVKAGETTRLDLTGLAGCEVWLDFRSPRYLVPNEFVHLEAVTPYGPQLIDLRWRNQRVIAGGFSFTVGLPASTSELNVVTETVDRTPVLEGHRSIAPGELDSGAPGELELELTRRE